MLKMQLQLLLWTSTLPTAFTVLEEDCIPFCGPGGIGSDIHLLSAIACQPFHITPTLNP